MKRILIIFTILSVLFSSAAFGQDKKKRVAILDPVTSESDDGLKLIVREIVSGCFVNYGDNYAIVERSQLDKIMQEAKFSNTGAVDEAQATELGKLAGADKIVLTVISKMGNRCMLSVKMIDVETATVEKQHSKIVRYDSMLDVIEPLTLVLLGKKSDLGSAAEAPGSDVAVNTTVDAGRGNTADGKIESCRWLRPSGFKTGGRYFEDFSDDYGLEALEIQQEVSVVFDFSQIYIDNQPLQEYLERNKDRNGKKGLTFVSELNTYTPEIEDRFISVLNDKFKKLRFTFRTGNPYTLVVVVKEADKSGGENLSDYIFFETSSGKAIGGVSLKAKDGRFGGFTNLFGDAMEDAAGKLASKLKKQFKKFRK